MVIASSAQTPRIPGQTTSYQRVVNATSALCIFFGMMSLIEPSPYDFLSVAAILLWFIGGARVNAFLLTITIIWTLRESSQFLALAPYWNEPSPVLFQFQSFYLYVTVVFYTFFFSEHVDTRMRLCLNSYAFGCFISSCVAILSYFAIFGFDQFTTYEGRVSGTFKDPNVFGSYMILGAAWLLQGLFLGRARFPLLTIGALGVILVGVFLSFSRGSWGGAILALILMTIVCFIVYRDLATRRRIVFTTIIAILLATCAIMAILSMESTREFFFQRLVLTQDYDVGETGRFGNQLRSIPMLIERPLGFGPLRYRLIFELDPHNSYIGAFANGGWLGGFLWLLIVGSSVYVGFRMMFTPSPYRIYAQAVFPALLALLLQGLQIDIDHWRQLFLQFGMIWGLEAARRRWLAHGQ